MVDDQARERRHGRQAQRRSSPRSPARSAWPPARVAATPTRTTGCGSRSRRRARSTCRPTTSSGAIDKATGGGEAEQFEEIVYEGYGPGGVAILVEAATDNRNRTAADVRAMFTKAGGQLAGAGAVAWQFEPRGLITIPANGHDPDDVALAAIDAGADDVDTSERRASSRCTRRRARSRRSARPSRMPASRSTRAENTMIAKNTVEVDEHRARQNLRLVEALEDLDDVQRVTANFDIPEELFAEVAG